jgi:hypothetical protein
MIKINELWMWVGLTLLALFITWFFVSLAIADIERETLISDCLQPKAVAVCESVDQEFYPGSVERSWCMAENTRCEVEFKCIDRRTRMMQRYMLLPEEFKACGIGGGKWQ